VWPDRAGVFSPLRDVLLTDGDYYMHLADFRSYLEADQSMLGLYARQDEWAGKAILNIASSGKFSSERSGSTRKGYGKPYRAQWYERGGTFGSDHDSYCVTEKSAGEHDYDRIVIECLSLPFDCNDQRDSRASWGHGLP
jgi:Carbohydrate phosphorylase